MGGAGWDSSVPRASLLGLSSSGSGFDRSVLGSAGRLEIRTQSCAALKVRAPVSS